MPLLLPLADQGEALSKENGGLAKWWGGSEESGVLAGWLVAGKVVMRSRDRGRNWPGGGRGGSPLEGIASPGVGRTQLEESLRMGRPARITRDYSAQNVLKLLAESIVTVENRLIKRGQRSGQGVRLPRLVASVDRSRKSPRVEP